MGIDFTKGLSKISIDRMPSAILLGIHASMHLDYTDTQNIEKECTVGDHLLVLQEMSNRGMEHSINVSEGLDFDTCCKAFAIGLSYTEISLLGLSEVRKQMVMQTLILDKVKFATKGDAVLWIKNHNFKIKPVAPDDTENSWRFRQRDPGEFVEESFRTISITDGVKGVVGKLKEANTNKRDVEKQVRLLPIDKAEDKRVVFGIVLEPETVDSQGDVISEDEISNAAHVWLAELQDRGIMHQSIENDKLDIYESYLAPVDFDVNGQEVKKGSWLLMYHVKDGALWEEIKRGEFTGFSIGGFARRGVV